MSYETEGCAMSYRTGYDAGYTKGHEDGYNAAKAESPRDWTPCADGMPTADGTYDVTLKSEFGRYFIEQNARFENGEWLTESDTGKVLAWMSPVAPYRANDTTGKVKEDAE